MNKRPPHSANHLVVEKYSRLAPDYDARWSHYVEESTRETLKRLNVLPGDRLLDVGCGTGFLLARLAQSHPPARLCGVDPTPAMIEIARHRLPPEVELREGQAEQLPFAAAQFDVLVSCSVFHYIRQPAAALREMARVLRRGGRLLLTDWRRDYATMRALDACLRLFNRAHYKTWSESELRRALNEAGFRDVRIERYRIDWFWGLMTATGINPSPQAIAV